MTTEQVALDAEGLRKATRKGVTAAILLAILSVAEFFIAEALENPLWPLMPFVILKCWIILDTFMHVRAVFQSGDDH